MALSTKNLKPVPVEPEEAKKKPAATAKAKPAAEPAMTTVPEEAKKKPAATAKAKPSADKPDAVKQKKSASKAKNQDDSDSDDDLQEQFDDLFTIMKKFFGKVNVAGLADYKDALENLAKGRRYREVIYFLRRDNALGVLQLAEKKRIDEFEKLIDAHEKAFGEIRPL